MPPRTYAKRLCTIKRFFRDFLKQPKLVESFRFPTIGFNPPGIPRKHDLQTFFNFLRTDRYRTLFLMYATSGLRKMEIFNLSLDDIDFENNMIIPKAHETNTTKKSYVRFYNGECQDYIFTGT